MEKDLRNSRRSYQRLAESIPDVFFAMDKDLRYIYWNKASETLTGISSKDAIGKTIFDIFPDNEETRSAALAYQEVIKTQHPQTFTNKYHLGGKAYFFEIHAYPFRSSISVFVKDITARKQAEEALRESQERYRALVENTSLGITIIDADYKIIMANTTVAKLFNKSAGDFVGKDCFRQYEGREAVCPHCPASRAMASGKTAEVETHGVRDNGSRFYVRNRAIPFYGPDSVVKGFVELIEDITEHKRKEGALKESEYKFKTIFENAIDGMLLADIENKKFLMGNKVICQMLGYSLGELKNMGVEDIHPKKELPFIIDQLESQAKKEFSLTTNIPVKKKDGSIFYADINASPMTLGGKPYMLGIFRDITERKKIEEKLKETHAELKKIQDVLLKREKIATTGVLAAGVAHEIRNPLAIIGMTVQYLQSKLGENDPKRELTEAIIKKVDKLDRVTKELSSYGRTMNLNIRKHNLARCLNLNLALIKPKCRIQRIKIRKRYSRLPLIEMDNEQMDKAFFNIMDNAVQAMSKGGILTVSTEFNEKAQSAIVKIHNTGSIIKKKHLSRIFEPFYTVKKKEGGTGLGLAIVQSVVLRHNGQVTVENKSRGKDKGVAFLIHLPVSQQQTTHTYRERERVKELS